MNTNDAEQFWREYEERIGEKILKYSLGRYLSGWTEYSGPLWGLLIVTEGGFRFHHFPHESWISALTRMGGGGGKAPTEKTFSVPRDRIKSFQVLREKSWLKRLITPTSPQLEIVYSGQDGAEQVLLLELDRGDAEIETSLRSVVTP